MTAPIRSLTAMPLDDHACKSCGGRGYHYDTSTHDYTPGAMVRKPCNDCCPPVYDTTSRKSSAQLLDEAVDAAIARDPDEYARAYHQSWQERYYYSVVIGGAVFAGIVWVAAELAFGGPVGVV